MLVSSRIHRIRHCGRNGTSSSEQREQILLVATREHTCVCSIHFEDDDFDNLMRWHLGYENRLVLTKIAVPSRKPAKNNVCDLAGSSVDPPRPAKKPRGNRAVLAMKLKVAREVGVKKEVAPCGEHQQDRQQSEGACAIVKEEMTPDEPGDNSATATMVIDPPCCALDKHIIQTEPPSANMSTQAGNQLVNTGVQAIRRGPYRSKEIQCSLIAGPPLELLTPSPLVADRSDDQAQEMAEEVPTPMTADDPPSVRLNFPDPRLAPHLKEKYIVFQQELMALFDTCPLCAKPASAVISKREGTCIHVEQECLHPSCGFSRVWRSQPYEKKMPLGNLLLSSAILFSGSLPTQALRILGLMNMQATAISTFFRHQSHYLFPVVELQWEIVQSCCYFVVKYYCDRTEFKKYHIIQFFLCSLGNSSELLLFHCVVRGVVTICTE